MNVNDTVYVANHRLLAEGRVTKVTTTGQITVEYGTPAAKRRFDARGRDITPHVRNSAYLIDAEEFERRREGRAAEAQRMALRDKLRSLTAIPLIDKAAILQALREAIVLVEETDV